MGLRGENLDTTTSESSSEILTCSILRACLPGLTLLRRGLACEARREGAVGTKHAYYLTFSCEIRKRK